MTKNICVVSDYNFLPKGIALYESLLKKTKDFILHYLCFDEKSFSALSRYKLDNLIPYSDSSFLKENSTLFELKEADRKYYSYTLASFFSNYLIDKLNSDIIYIDSDIYFHDDLQTILDEISEKDIGIFRHRQYNIDVPNGNGWFNVGVIFFKNSSVGKNSLNWWADAVLNRRYPELATCGDQRYLDVFKNLPKENVFIDGNIGHGAPWQWMLYDFTSYQIDQNIIWNGKKQKLIFSHFSQFQYFLDTDSYIPSTMHHCFTPLSMYSTNESLKKIYDEYFKEIKNVHKKYNL